LELIFAFCLTHFALCGKDPFTFLYFSLKDFEKKNRDLNRNPAENPEEKCKASN